MDRASVAGRERWKCVGWGVDSGEVRGTLRAFRFPRGRGRARVWMERPGRGEARVAREGRVMTVMAFGSALADVSTEETWAPGATGLLEPGGGVLAAPVMGGDDDVDADEAYFEGDGDEFDDDEDYDDTFDEFADDEDFDEDSDAEEDDDEEL